MNAAEILHTAQAAGVMITPDGNDLLLEALTPPPALLLDEIKRQKPQIAVLLGWREFYDERAGIAEYDGGMTRDKAERTAYESCISRWLDTHPPAHTNDTICPHCQRHNGAPGTSCIPTLSGNGGHLWLHHSCLEPWRERRRQEAIAALATSGIIGQGGISPC